MDKILLCQSITWKSDCIHRDMVLGLRANVLVQQIVSCSRGTPPNSSNMSLRIFQYFRHLNYVKIVWAYQIFINTTHPNI